MNNLVLFDIGAVQIRLNYRSMFDELGRLSCMRMEEAKAAYVASGIENEAMKGSVPVCTYFDTVRKIFGLEASDDEMRRILSLSWEGYVRPVMELKRRLIKAGYYVGNFSNISQFAMDVIGSMCPDIFGSDNSYPGIYSYRIGDIKPNSQMYQRVTGFNDVIYIDDNIRYVAKGHEMGWKCILFTPFADPSEAVRSSQQDEEVHSSGFKVANSEEELALALSGFGLKF